MTADQFVASLRKIAAAYRGETMSDRARAVAEEKLRMWDTIVERATPALEHSPDAILDLIARYDLSAVTFWQFAFTPEPAQTFEKMWVVARRTTHEYFVERGQVFEMDMKAAYPTEVGMTSEQFLSVLAIYAEQSLRLPGVLTLAEMRPMQREFAARAAAAHPRSSELGWFD